MHSAARLIARRDGAKENASVAHHPRSCRIPGHSQGMLGFRVAFLQPLQKVPHIPEPFTAPGTEKLVDERSANMAANGFNEGAREAQGFAAHHHPGHLLLDGIQAVDVKLHRIVGLLRHKFPPPTQIFSLQFLPVSLHTGECFNVNPCEARTNVWLPKPLLSRRLQSFDRFQDLVQKIEGPLHADLGREITA